MSDPDMVQAVLDGKVWEWLTDRPPYGPGPLEEVSIGPPHKVRSMVKKMISWGWPPDVQVEVMMAVDPRADDGNVYMPYSAMIEIIEQEAAYDHRG